jgi:site-specific DNA-methyltransferase (adenine-specific)
MIDKLRLESVVEETGVRELKIMCTGELQVDWKNLLDLQTVEDGRSLKKTDDDKITRLAESLIRFGIVNNLQVWFDINDGNACFCFDAHHRVKAFAAMIEVGVKIPPLPATRCLAVDKTEARKMLLLKESTASWVDVEVVPDYLREIGFDIEVASYIVDLPDFEWSDCEEIADQQKALDEKAEQIPDISDEIYIKKGDLIELGSHRLLCGDSIKAKNIKKLLNSEQWDCIIFDPPYELEKLYGKIPKYSKGQKLVVFWDFKRFGIAPAEAIKKGWKPQYEFIWDNVTSWYTPNRPLQRHKACGIFCNDPFFNTEKAIIEDGKQRKAKIVSNTRGKCDYKPLNGAKHISTVEQFQNTKVEGDHGHAKPMDWIQAIYEGLNCEIFFDMFGGSGSTLIYAEKNNKRSFTMELEPKYCQVTVQRWVDFTGNTEISINGKIHDWRELCGE